MIGKIFLIGITLIIIIMFMVGIIMTGVFDYNEDDSSVTVTLAEEDKSTLVDFLREIKDRIYHEATINNPEGDVLPDELDNEIIKEIKDRVR